MPWTPPEADAVVSGGEWTPPADDAIALSPDNTITPPKPDWRPHFERPDFNPDKFATSNLGKEARAIGDMIVGFPAFLARMGVTGALTTGAAVAGVENPASWANEIVAEAGKTSFNKFLAAPMGTLAGDENPEETIVGRIGEVLQEAVVSGGKTAEDQALREQALNAAMGILAVGGAKGVAKGKEWLDRKRGERKADPATDGLMGEIKAETAAEPFVEAGINESIPGQKSGASIWGSTAKDQIIERRAYDLMQNGADLRTVEKLTKKNPALGAAMERLRKAREDAAAAFDRDFGARQGEVVDYAVDWVPGKAGEAPWMRLPAISDLTARFRAAGIEADAAQAAAEAAHRQPAGTGMPYDLDPITGRLRPADAGLKGATPHDIFRADRDLQSAVDKMASGRSFELTAEERIAWQKAGPHRPIESPAELPRDTPDNPALLHTANPLYSGPVEMFTFDPIRAAKEVFKTLRGAPKVDEAALKEAAKKIYLEKGEEAAQKFISSVRQFGEDRSGVMEAERLVGQSINDLNAAAWKTRVRMDWTMKEAPDALRREKIGEAIDTGRLLDLPPQERVVANQIKAWFADIGQRAVEAGVLKGLRENYITHIVDWQKSQKTPTAELIESLLGRIERTTGATVSRFSKQRKYDDFEALTQALKDSGLELRTKDAAEIYRAYANSMEKAIAGKSLVQELKTLTDSQGFPLARIISAKKPMPRGWEQINAAGLRNMAVHPDIAPYVRHFFDQTEPGALLKAAHSVSQAVKRINVIASLFHAKSLLEASWNAHGPIATLKDLGAAVIDRAAGTKLSGITKALELFRKEGVEVEGWLKSGLELQIPEDVSRTLLQQVGAVADDAIARFGPRTHAAETALGFAEKYTLGITDHFTWDYLHTGLKLNTAMAMLEKAMRDNPNAPRAELMKTISSHVNDTFGGLNWYQAASEIQSQFLKEIAMAAYSRQGRMGLQILLFAPDWTLSTVRAFTSMVGKNSGVMGLVKPRYKADFARRYQLRTALTYAILVDQINRVISGHGLSENRDKTRIEFPDGTSLQPMKHAAEPYHWAATPTQTLANKLGFIPKAAGTLISGNEYFSPHAPKLKDNSVTGRAVAVAKGALPFQAQAAMSAPPGERVKRAVLGSAGFPVYGKPKTMEERERIIRYRERKARKEQEAKHGAR